MINFLLPIAICAPLAAQGQVPLQLYTDAQWPNGVDTGPNNGVSFADFNGDGWTDLFVCQSGVVWANQGGQGWAVAANLKSALGASSFRYGSSLGDFNRDGLPDIASEPRKGGPDDCLHLFRNLGGWNFLDISGDRNLVDAALCGALAETVAWADWDGDRDLDMFFPSYPLAVGSLDNRFLQNLGPTGPGGAYRFTEIGQEIGLAIPAGAARPEGVVIFDLDADGDIDLYSNGHWYRNLSQYGQSEFMALEPSASGVGKSTVVDEGTILIDYDQDGDLDLLVCYTTNRGIRIWQNRGDGTFAATSTDLVEDYLNGATFGASAIDWDNDGDIDITTLDTFRRNTLAETGVAGFELISHNSAPEASTPGWADWDLDGDMDMAVGSATNNFLYQNTTYDANTAPADKRHVRIRVVDDAPGQPRGLETEFGAVARIDVLNAGAGRPLVQVVSSAAGYINQNEYALHFALPADPTPSDPSSDVRFDLRVDFPSLPQVGFWRVGARVNPVLSNLDLALLEDREIIIFRSGKVQVNGQVYDPVNAVDPRLVTTTGGLRAPHAQQRMPGLEAAPHTDFYVGVELDTVSASAPLRVEELLLDGELGQAEFCGSGLFGNVALWDISSAGSPILVDAMAATLPAENRRGHYAADMMLQPGKIYRLVARMNSFRRSPFVRALQDGELRIAGGLRVSSTQPCDGHDFEQAALDPSGVFLSVRVRPNADARWFDLGHAQSLPGNAPQITATGHPSAGQTIQLQITGAAPNTGMRLIAGARLNADDSSGIFIHADAQFVLQGTTDAQGNLTLSSNWPDRHQPGLPIFFQAVVGDPATGTAATSPLLAVLGE
jgi:hypothetical protein